MATRTTTAELAETIASKQKTITQALSRLRTPTAAVASLRNEVKRFKQDVAKDVTYLTERVG